MELFSIDERIRKLCAKLATAKDHEIPGILAELRSALQEHAHLVRRIATRTLTKLKEKDKKVRAPSDEAA